MKALTVNKKDLAPWTITQRRNQISIITEDWGIPLHPNDYFVISKQRDMPSRIYRALTMDDARRQAIESRLTPWGDNNDCLLCRVNGKGDFDVKGILRMEYMPRVTYLYGTAKGFYVINRDGSLGRRLRTWLPIP